MTRTPSRPAIFDTLPQPDTGTGTGIQLRNRKCANKFFTEKCSAVKKTLFNRAITALNCSLTACLLPELIPLHTNLLLKLARVSDAGSKIHHSLHA
ncbi:hypothetical protein [Burkholderia cepacia]|uniref:hypothetical protein n=1 Tax=Burkholderia cepacia TaxID=292 RepID=UPI0011B275F3|nr:hypothetical protein [Burkholderia cepacia]